MKTKNLFRKILPAALLLALMVIIAVSCKKKESVEPVTPPVNPPEAPVDIFSNKPPDMMTQYEIARDRKIPINLLMNTSSGLQGGVSLPEIPDVFMQIADIVWHIQDGTTSDNNYSNVTHELNNISQQITALSAQVNDLSNALDLQTVMMKDFAINGKFNEYITAIGNAVMDSSTSIGLTYYARMARDFQKGSISEAQWNEVKSSSVTWSTQNSSSVINSPHDAVSQIYSIICPKLSPEPSENGLMPHAQVLFTQFYKSHSGDGNNVKQEDIKSAFLIFESYFVTILNYQVQGAIAYCNAVKAVHPLETESETYINEVFAPMLRKELDMYLYTVDYLAINLADFHHFSNFENDSYYRDAGIAPDDMFNGPLARAQVLTNIVYKGLGLSFPYVAGTIITPHKYTSNNLMNQQVDSITVGIATWGQITATARDTKNGKGGMLSQFSYAYWDDYENPYVPTKCSPDNHWNVYRFGKLGVGSNYPRGTQPISVEDNNSSTYPWPHKVKIAGQVQLYYYNPDDLNDFDTYQRTSSDIPLAFFCQRWNWGYAYITNTTAWSHTSCNFWMQPNMPFDNHGDIEAPSVATTDNQGTIYPHSSEKFYYGDNTIGSMSCNCNTISTDNYYLVHDAAMVQIQTGPSTNQQIPFVYGLTNVSLTGGGFNNSEIVTSALSPNTVNAFAKASTKQKANTATAVGGLQLLAPNKLNHIVANYQYSIKGIGNNELNTVQVNTTNYIQVVYEGSTNILK